MYQKLLGSHGWYGQYIWQEEARKVRRQLKPLPAINKGKGATLVPGTVKPRHHKNKKRTVHNIKKDLRNVLKKIDKEACTHQRSAVAVTHRFSSSL